MHHIIHHQYPCWWWFDGRKHDLSGRDTCKRSNRCVAPRGLTRLPAGSWQVFWFDGNFSSTIFNQVMAKIRNGGGSRTVAFQPFWRLCNVTFFSEVRARAIFPARNLSLWYCTIPVKNCTWHIRGKWQFWNVSINQPFHASVLEVGV